MTTVEPIGRVAGLWRYPVQSMQGEAMREVTLWANGMPGDRAWGLLNPAEGKIAAAATGKKPWRDLIRCQARFLREPEKSQPNAPAEIHLPDGGTIATEAATAPPSAAMRCNGSLARSNAFTVRPLLRTRLRQIGSPMTPSPMNPIVPAMMSFS